MDSPRSTNEFSECYVQTYSKHILQNGSEVPHLVGAGKWGARK